MASSSQVLLPLKVVYLDKEDEIQKIPLQPPYYDMAQSESTAFTDKPVSSAAKLIAVLSLPLLWLKTGLWCLAVRGHIFLSVLHKMNCLLNDVYIKRGIQGDVFSGLYCVSWEQGL